MEIKAIVDCKTTLGEGPLWDVKEQKLYWIDSLGMKIFRANADGNGCESWSVPQRIGSLALREAGGAILSLADGFYLFDFDSGHLTLLRKIHHASAEIRLNDGKVDRVGRFVAGSMDTTESNREGILYSVSHLGDVAEIERNIIVSNGPCWSPDGKKFYFADSRLKTIWSYDYDEANGIATNRVVFASFGPEDGLPDGATVDAEGCVWSAGVYAGKIHRFSPAGELLMTIEMPVVCVSSVMFGGPALDILYVTTMSTSPVPDVVETGALAGSLFAISGLGVCGVPEMRYAG